MKSVSYTIALVVFLAACAPATASVPSLVLPTATVEVAPTGTKVVSGTPEGTPRPAETAITPDQLNQIIKETQQNIGTFTFAPDAAHPGDYSVVSVNGKTVDHLYLGADGKIHVELEDGWKPVPASTFHLDTYGINPNDLRAAIYKIDTVSGDTSVVPVIETVKDQTAVWLTDSLFSDGTYAKWMLEGMPDALLRSGRSLETDLAGTDPDLQFHTLTINEKLKGDVNEDGIPDVYGGEFFVPEKITTRNYMAGVTQIPYHWGQIPFRSYPFFVVKRRSPRANLCFLSYGRPEMLQNSMMRIRLLRILRT